MIQLKIHKYTDGTYQVLAPQTEGNINLVSKIFTKWLGKSELKDLK